MITAKELAKIFDELKPSEEHYFDMPDSEIVQIKPHSIVFPYQFDGELPRKKFITDGDKFFSYFSKISIEEINCKNGKKVVGVSFYKRDDDEDAIFDFYVKGEKKNENKSKKKR